MDLSYEARWLDLRRQLDVDIAYLNERAQQAIDGADFHRATMLGARVQSLEVVRSRMDDLDRAGAHRA